MHYISLINTFLSLGCSPFVRHYLGNHSYLVSLACKQAKKTKKLFYCFLFLRLLRCFTSAGMRTEINFGTMSLYDTGFPHSEILGSKLAYQLPEAYRRLLRPSSPFQVEASTTCLNLRIPKNLY